MLSSFNCGEDSIEDLDWIGLTGMMDLTDRFRVPGCKDFVVNSAMSVL